MRAYLRSGGRAAVAAAAVAVMMIGLGSAQTAEAAPLGASAGSHVADVATSNPGVERVHRRYYHRHWRPYYGYGYGYRYRPYYSYPYRRHYGFYGGYPYYGGYGWGRPGVYLRFGF